MAAKEIIPGCAVCPKPHFYDTEGPFLLPCLHSVCENCLKYENDKTLFCSSCQETFPKASFPIDAVTRKKTLLFTLAHNSNELLCTNKDDGNQAMSWCQECEAFLCEHCHVAHGDMKATRKHKVILVQDLTNCPQTLKCMSYCGQHAQHPVTLYDSTCNVPLCAMCVLAEHTSCKTEDLDTAWETRQSFLEDKEVALRAKLGRLQECRTLQEDIGQRLKPQQEAVEEVIRCTFQKLHLMLDQREIELKTEIEESTKFLTERSDHQLVTLQSEVDKLTVNLEFIQMSTLLLNPVEHFAMKDVMDKRITVASESEIPRISTQEYAIALSTDGLHGFQQQISSLGALMASRIRSDVVVTDSRGTSHIVQIPSLRLDKTSLNTDQVRIRDDEFLTHGKQLQRGRSPGSFRKYSGTVSSHPLTLQHLQYWEVKVFLELLQNPGMLLLFETGVCVHATIDDGVTVCSNVHSFVMFAALCDVHGGICVQSRKHGRNTRCLQHVVQNTVGASSELCYGFLFNPMEGSVRIVDVRSECVEIEHMEDMETNVEYWPVFGVFNGHLAKVHMSVVSGRSVKFGEVKKRWIQDIFG
ncbi:E3 ubiquitin-protein ligase TRIM45-like [Haliotis asinina]|uniref:E3 ubiquitin-protein ligase TRIM45-like n=1 Tax=Haliotis asinina TaxID=109174 RepID=UPI003532766D